MEEERKIVYLSIFRKHQATIIDLVQPMVDRLLDKAYSEGLIIFYKKDDIITTQGDTQYSKAGQILHEVDRTLQHASLVEVRSTLLIFVCKILQSFNDPGLTRFANEFMVELKEVPEVVAVSICKPEIESVISEESHLEVLKNYLHREEVIDSTDISHDSLCNVIISNVERKPQSLQNLIAHLKHTPPDDKTRALAKQLEKELEHSQRYNSSTRNPLEAVDSSHFTRRALFRTRLPSSFEQDVQNVISHYDDMISTIASLFEAACEEQQDLCSKLKKCLKRSIQYQRCVADIEDMDKIDDLIYFAAKKNSSLLNVEHLNWLVKRFDITTGKDAIDDYNHNLQLFREHAKVKLFENNVHVSEALATKAETIEFTIRKEPEDTLVDEIEQIIQELFDDLSPLVNVKLMGRRHSITVVCFAPEAVIGLLIAKAQQKLPTLIKDRGLMSLKIGYCTLLEYNSEFEINRSLIIKAENDLLKQIEVKKVELLMLQEEINSAKTSELELQKHFEGKEDYVTRIEELKEKNEKLQSQVDSLPDSSKQEEDIEELKKEKEDMYMRIKELQKMTDDKEQDVFSDDVESLQMKYGKVDVESLQMKYDELLEGHDMLKQQKRAMAAQLDSTMELKSQNELMMSEIAHMRGTIETRIPVLSFHSKNIQYPPLTIVMGDFNERRKNGTEWYSPAFYSHHEGYKLCLKVVANGHDTGKGSHVSAYIHLMSGEYDDKLSWPFKADIELQLLNRQANEHHRSFFVHFNDSSREEATSRVQMAAMIDSGMVAWRGQGTDELIQHSDLSFNTVTQTEYLKDNSLLIQCKSIKTQGPPPTPSSATAPPPSSQAMEEFKMENFSSLRAKNDKWQSPPFYSHENGYKFVLRVHPNGSFQHKGKSVSVYVHLMKGEFDKNLVFPFRGKIIVQAINQMEDKNHVEFPVMFDEETDPDGKLGASVRFWDNIRSGYSSEGWGISNFLPHDLLPNNKHRNTKYLTDNDQVIFRIAKIEVLSGHRQ